MTIAHENRIQYIIIGVICVIFFLILFQVSSYVTVDQYVIFIDNFHIDYILGLIGVIVLTLALIVFPFFFQKKILLFAWLSKIALIFIVDFYYEGQYFIDSFNYFATAIVNSETTRFFLFSGTSFVTSLLSFFYSLSYPSYKLAVVFFTFIGFLAQYMIWLALSGILKNRSQILLLLILFTPTLFFWSHGIGKEALTLFFLAFYLLGMKAIFKKSYQQASLFIAIAFLGFFLLRFWLVIIFGFALIVTLFFAQIPTKKKIPIIGLIVVPLLLLFFYIANIYGVTGPNSLIEIVNDSTRALAYGNSSQFIEVNTITSYIIQYPSLFFTIFFMPLIIESGNLFQLIVGIENSFLLIAVIFACIAMIRFRLWRSTIIKMCIIHIVVWSIIYVFISSRNLGLASRFKLQIFPFILVFLYILITTALHKRRKYEKNLLSHPT